MLSGTGAALDIRHYWMPLTTPGGTHRALPGAGRGRSWAVIWTAFSHYATLAPRQALTARSGLVAAPRSARQRPGDLMAPALPALTAHGDATEDAPVGPWWLGLWSYGRFDLEVG